MCEYIAPCKDCPNRSAICHTICKEYIEYRAKMDERNEHIRKEKESDLFWRIVRKKK